MPVCPWAFVAFSGFIGLMAAARAADAPPAPDLADGEILDWGQVPFPGDNPAPPAWQPVMEEAQDALQAAFMAHQADDGEEAARWLGVAEALSEDPSLPPAQAGQLLYMLGMLAQQIGDHGRAAALFGRMAQTADAEGAGPPREAALMKGLGLVQRAELEFRFLDRPDEALRLFGEVRALADLPAGFRSSLLSRLVQIRLAREAYCDAAEIMALAREEMAWSVHENRGGLIASDPRLPGNWAAALALNGQADEARAIVDACGERAGSGGGEALFTGEMALALALACGALEDAAGAAAWLERDLGHRARFNPTDEMAVHLRELEAMHALRPVLGDDKVRGVLSAWRDRVREASEAGLSQVGDVSALFGDLDDLDDLGFGLGG